jgi:hypothetical protein
LYNDDNGSKVNNILFLFGEGLNVVLVVVLIVEQFLVLVDVVQHVPQAHLRLYPLLPNLLTIRHPLLLVELLLDGGQQLEAVLGRIGLHILEEVAVDHQHRQFLERLHLRPVHHLT